MRRGALILVGVVTLALGIVGYAVRAHVLDEWGRAPWGPVWTAMSWGLVIGGSWLTARGTINGPKVGEDDDEQRAP